MIQISLFFRIWQGLELNRHGIKCSVVTGNLSVQIVLVTLVLTLKWSSGIHGDLQVKRCSPLDSADNDDKNYFRSYDDIGIHEEMIADRVRTSTYRLAILKNYEAIKDKVVLDIGAGTGILSMFCVQAGARKVYAIEASEIASQAELVFESNGAADKVVVLKGKVEEVEIPEEVDVIVSEWMGYFLLYETMLPSVLYARDKWLKKGGLMLPGKATIYMAPISDLEYADRLDFWEDVKDTYKIDMSCVKPYATRSLNKHVHVHQVEPQDVLSHRSEICTFDLHSMSRECLERVQGNFSFDCFGTGNVNGFVSWFDVYFPHDIKLTTSPEKQLTHWQQSVLYLNNPLSVKQGTVLNGSIVLTPNPKYHRFLDINLKYEVGEQEYEQYHLMDDFIL